MSKALKWPGGLLLVAVLAIGGYWAFVQGRGELASERAKDQPIKAPPRVSRGLGGEAIVTLDPATQERMGLRVEELKGISFRPEVMAYGVLQEDPAGTFAVRAPLSGALVESKERSWPRIGEMLSDGAVVGALSPGLGPLDRVDLSARLAAWRADVEATSASLGAARQSLERLRVLNAENKNVSDRAVQEAVATVKGEEARLQAARETMSLVESALSARPGRAGSVPLIAARGGEVIESPARPGESVSGGDVLLRVERFDRLLASVSVAPGESIDLTSSTARVFVVGYGDHPVTAERVGFVPSVDPKALGEAMLLRLPVEAPGWRPGLAVTAYLPSAGEAREGVEVPRAAVARAMGGAWVYVQSGPDRFVRRGISTDQPTGKGWFVSEGLKAGQRVVVTGAVLLLSEEMKSQIQITE